MAAVWRSAAKIGGTGIRGRTTRTMAQSYRLTRWGSWGSGEHVKSSTAVLLEGSKIGNLGTVFLQRACFDIC